MKQYDAEKITKILIQQGKEIARLKDQISKIKVATRKSNRLKNSYNSIQDEVKSLGRSPRQIWSLLEKNFFK